MNIAPRARSVGLTAVNFNQESTLETRHTDNTLDTRFHYREDCRFGRRLGFAKRTSTIARNVEGRNVVVLAGTLPASCSLVRKGTELLAESWRGPPVLPRRQPPRRSDTARTRDIHFIRASHGKKSIYAHRCARRIPVGNKRKDRTRLRGTHRPTTATDADR